MTPAPGSLRFGAIALTLLAAGCDDDAGARAAAAAPGPQALPVAVLEVRAETLPITIEAVGRAEGSREVEIRARVAGVLEQRLYDEGAAVAAGKVLFVIDPKPYELAVEQAKAALLQAQVRQELAAAEARRLAPLAAEKAISQRELDNASAAEREAAAAIAGAEARLKEAQLNLSYTRVTAPIAGLTGRALRSEGSLVRPDDASGSLTTLTQVNPIWVRFSLAARDFERIRAATRGAEVQLIADDGTVLADGGKLNFAGNTVDEQLGTVPLRAEFANPQRRWLPGQFVKVRVLAGEQKAMRVPQRAILQAEGGRSVMVITAEGTAAPRPVQAVSWIGEDAIVTSGLAEGDRVIVDNLIKVRPGMPVQAKDAGSAPAAAAAPAG